MSVDNGMLAVQVRHEINKFVSVGNALISGPTKDADVVFDFKNGIYRAEDATFFSFTDALTSISGAFTRPSSAFRWNANGVLATSSVDTPDAALQLNPYVEQRGLLVERASYNRIIDTGGITSGGDTNATVSTSNLPGPDGVSLSRRTVTSTVSNGYVQSPNATIGAPFASSLWTWSVIVPKQSSSQVAKMEGVAVGGSGIIPNINFNALTGAATSSQSSGDFGVQDLGDWWMPWVTDNINTNTIGQMKFFPVSGGTGSLDFCYPQIEPGHGPTSRIITSGTAGLRRERDNVVIPATRLATTGAFTITARPSGGAITRVIAQVDDGTENNRITVQRNSSGNIEVVSVRNGVTIGTNAHGAHVAGAEVTVSVTWSGTSVRSQRDYGGLLLISGSLPASVRHLRLGANSAGVSAIDGVISRLSIWWGAEPASQIYRAPSVDFVTAGDSMAAGAGVSTAPEHWGSILGVNLKRTRTNIAAGGTTSTEAKDTFLAQTANVRGQILLLYTGHNDPTDTALVMANIATILSNMSNDLAKRRFLIGLPCHSTANAVGGVGYNGIVSLRSLIAAAYPDNYVDVPGALLAAATALGDTAGSDTNIANGYTPARYLGDTIHLNAAGQIVEETAWRAKMLAMGY